MTACANLVTTLWRLQPSKCKEWSANK